MVSLQSSPTAIIAFLAPIQMLAVLAQAILAFFYETTLHMSLAIACFAFIVIVNIVFVVRFH